MITVSELSLNFSGQPLFKDVNLKFTPGNCYGIIGANGAGKTTFLRILSGDLEPSTGEVVISDNQRMSVLKQDHFQYDEYTVLDTVIMGNQRLYDIMKEKDALYEKEDFSDADGVRASELEAEFADMDGWEAESGASRLIQGLGLSNDILYSQMSSLTAKEKVKVLLAQALFGKPDIILLDEPTNHLDLQAIEWLENFLMEYEGLIIVVSHDRYFLNNVCTSIVDVDYGKIKMYVGNYEFWYESSQMVQKMMKDQNRKNEDKIKELQLFIQRFSANKSKSKQATSRRKLLDKLTVEEMPASSRRYPFVGFAMDREPGKEILTVEGLSKTIDGRKLLNNVSFRVNKGDKIAFVGENELAKTTLFKIIMEELEADEGSFKWGTTISTSYFPLDNSAFFNDCNLNLVEWLGQYTADNAEEGTESFKRSFLGRMLFSGDEVFKAVKVLSGGEKVRCMLSRMMLFGSNALVLDQPTNHLDLESITAVNKGLIEYKGVVLFASHDHEFVQTVANRIIDFQPDGTIIDKACTYDDYIELQKAEKA
ncbi:ABC-F family ATP-binding cassette domain-containing protein [Oscillibacter valericigenes]|jgi:ATPase subunit of ABC transporter with duplicated ATPase domains|uniref:ABC-F family ATP-binding cassette domain-containing protein n=1 Tax=Oscillibacter ruminantium TaxID=1263547 RepID=UPI0002FF44BA|nr:ABC-F family ATP-binding cassette domain-containing protein [Oscillibacter ruminantium]MDN0032350.1 ABC-F family ATP-binding cassette domain-containing protein [Oscillibacter valericigenes]MEA5042266.1 ABC-F family ATP-binding cassette domain-containing protein [Oscillibacter ruminantium]